MRLYTLLILYFLFLSFCYCHDLNHADPVTIKQSEASVTIDPLSKNIETTNVQNNENENARFQIPNDLKKSIDDSNQVPISTQNDITTPSAPVQILPSVNDISKTIPISTDRSNLKDAIPSIQPDQLNEETSFTHTQSHIPPPSNSNSLDLKSDQQEQIPLKPTQTTTTSDTSIVQNESHPSRILRPPTLKPHQKHPRHFQTEDILVTESATAEPTQQSITDENKTQTNDQPINNTIAILKSNVSSLKEDSNNKSDIENATTVPSIQDTNAHLPRILENENNNETNQYLTESNKSSISTTKNRQICWRLPKRFEPSIELLENQLFYFVNIIPEFLQTILFGRIDDREILMNTMWLGSICSMCFLFSFLFLSMGTKRLKQTKQEKQVRARCQQLQQYNNQIELERATFERQNQKLSEQIDELKNLSVRDTDEDIFVLRTECTQLQEVIKTARLERETLEQDLDHKQKLVQKYEYDLKEQVEIVARLNNQILRQKEDFEKERATIARLQSNDLSLERFEKSQEIIQELKSEITQLKQDKFIDKNLLQEIQEHSNQLYIENHQLTLKIKQLKDLFEQRNQTIKLLNEKTFKSDDLLSIITDNSSFLSIIDNDIQKSTQHIHNLHSEIIEKTHRIKELEILFKQEKDHCREIETKLKVVLELRERDAHLHIRQLGQTDAELRKARNDTERIRILQQQLELKQQQLDDIQKVLSNEQMKFNEECSKLQHETHEKWMEVKRLTRELEASKKECEGLRRQITKYASNERSSQEKTRIKPTPQHFGESETTGSSPISYQQGENFRPIDYQRNDSGAPSPTEMLLPRPPPFGLSRPPFFPAPFMPPPPPNPFIMYPRFPMSTPGSHGIVSPIPHLLTNGNDTNNSGIIDSSNLTPNSTSYDVQSNGAVVSPIPDDEKQIKPKKSKEISEKENQNISHQRRRLMPILILLDLF